MPSSGSPRVTTDGLQRPLALSPLCEAPVKRMKIGSVILDLEWRAAKCVPGHGEISGMIVNLNLAVAGAPPLVAHGLKARPGFRIVAAGASPANLIGKTGIQGAHLVAINLMEKFSIIWMWTHLVAAIFLGSPWIIYQVWAFISPGLYKEERRWAVPFILAIAGLFITGGCFAYFIAFRYALVFLLGIEPGVTPMISIDSYFDTFVDVMLGISAVFEMPVIIFFLLLLRLATPKFLMEHSRYAILAIVIIAAVITPTPDVFNLMLFA